MERSIRKFREYERPGKEWFSVDVYTYVHSDLKSRIIKNCRGEKGRGGKKHDFRSKLGFRLYDITMSKEDNKNNKSIFK